jgi:hypothetical protein
VPALFSKAITRPQLSIYYHGQEHHDDDRVPAELQPNRWLSSSLKSFWTGSSKQQCSSELQCFYCGEIEHTCKWQWAETSGKCPAVGKKSQLYFLISVKKFEKDMLKNRCDLTPHVISVPGAN